MIHGHFRPRRHLMTADRYRRSRDEAFRVWRQETLYLVAVSGRSRGMRSGQPEGDVRPRVCGTDGAPDLTTAPSTRSDGSEGLPVRTSLHRQGGSARGGAPTGRRTAWYSSGSTSRKTGWTVHSWR